MYRIIALVLLGLCIGVFGCGGGGGGGTTVATNIQATRFAPRSITTSPGNFVAFRNQDTVPHQVVSGTLVATPTPVVRPVVTIQQNNQFVPSTINANLGDTLQFRNDRFDQFTMNVVDDNGNVVATIPIQTGQTIQFSNFPHAGQFSFQQAGNQFFSATATIFGIPNPDNQFTSPILQPSQTFTKQFQTTGNFPFFDLNLTDMNQSFATGNIIVQ